MKPGTVSKILWHFTGGPKWNDILKKQEDHLKDHKEAYDNLCNIIKTKEIRLGKYKEIVRCMIDLKIYEKKTYRFKRNRPVELESLPICCLSDIPINHLDYHSDRYGKFAIGFYRESIIGSHFNPVLYTFDSATLLGRIISSIKDIRSLFSDIQFLYDEMDSMIIDINEGNESRLSGIPHKYKPKFQRLSLKIKQSLETGHIGLMAVVAFIKTISEYELNTIYCEREWRSISPFNFKYCDIAMIVLPKNIDGKNYFQRFIKSRVKQLKIPRKVPIVAWEDLIES